MLRVTIPKTEFFDETTSSFIAIKETVLQLEHSLISLSKWESKWQKPFISKEPKTVEQTIDYIKCMTLNTVDENAYLAIPPDVIRQVNDYIESPMTATTFREEDTRGKSRQIITSEIIYYQMVALQIPFECQKWHLNRLLTLIRVCAIKNQPPKKMGKKALASRNAALNAERRSRLNSKG